MSVAGRENQKPGASTQSTSATVANRAPAERQAALSFRLAAQVPAVPTAPTSGLRVQRLAGEELVPSEPGGAAPSTAGADAAFIVEDDGTAALLPSQLRKSSFLEVLRVALTSALDEAFVGTPHSAAGCPTLEKWLSHYEGRSAAELEGTLRRYLGAGPALSAADYIAEAAARVRLAGAHWVATGEITATPDLLAAAAAGGQETSAPEGAEEAPALMPLSAGGSAAAPAHPAAVQRALGPGAPLPGEVRGEMEAGFGDSLGAVRVHTDARAGTLALGYGAHAFTVGQHIAFAPGSYAPGTLRGDLVLAHELAHTRQQRGGDAKAAAPEVAESRDQERAADQAAIGTMARLYGGGQWIARSLGESISSALKSPLALQRCRSSDKTPKIKSGLDRGLLENAGAAVKLDGAAAAAAAKANDKQWSSKLSAKNRVDLLTWLRNGTPAKDSDTFAVVDVQEIARLQQGAGIVPSGKTDDATLAVLLHAGLKFSDESFQKPGDVVIEMFPGELEDLVKWKQLHDAWKQNWRVASQIPLPGEGKLYVKVRGQLVAKYDVRGGPPFKFVDTPPHTAGPTEAGTYHLGAKRAYTTGAWKYSQIRWGAALKKDASGEIMFKGEDGKWQYASGPQSKLSTKFDKNDSGFWKEDGTLKSTWDRNDFGPAAWQLLPDGKGPSDQYVHTTPYEEEHKVDDNLQLECSHGCVHADPKHRDEMVTRGYLQKGVKFVVHNYDEHLLPEKARKAMMP